MISGDTGVSSRVIASVVLRLEQDGHWIHTPLDPADFCRCLKLVNLHPGIRKALPKVAKVSDKWEEFIKNWDIIEKSFMMEVPEWLEDKNPDKSAPVTYKLMKLLENEE